MNTGLLRVGARWAAGRLESLEVALERPAVTELFTGQPANRVEAGIPLFYSLCREAQSLAAGAALAAARGEEPRPPACTTTQALWREVVHEHLWRLLLDWPKALCLNPPRTAFAAWRRHPAAEPARLAATTRQLFVRTLGVDPATRQLCRKGLAARCLGRLQQPLTLFPPAATPLPDLAPWLADGADPLAGMQRFETEKTAGTPCPSPPPGPGPAYARQLSRAIDAWQGLAARRPYPLAFAGRDGRGLGLTCTARGLLLHEAALQAGARVERYRIWAPTDRLFADAAPLARQLRTLAPEDAGAARRALELSILALDPCVPWQIDWKAH